MENADSPPIDTFSSSNLELPQSTEHESRVAPKVEEGYMKSCIAQTTDGESSDQMPASPKQTLTSTQDEPLDFSSHHSVPVSLKRAGDLEDITAGTDGIHSTNDSHSPVSVADKCYGPDRGNVYRDSGISNPMAQFEVSEANDIDLHSEEADEIVKKLCKNGKLMQFQEGDDYIKVIVYEDSQENDGDGTMSADETEDTSEGGCSNKNSEHFRPKNLLECLSGQPDGSLDLNNNSLMHADVAKNGLTSPNQKDGPQQNYEQKPSASQISPQWYGGMFGTTPMEANHTVSAAPPVPTATHSNFSHAVSQLTPSFIQGNTDMPIYASHQYGSENKMFYTPHPKAGYMFYPPEELSGHSTGSTSSCMRTPRATSTPMYRPRNPMPNRLNLQMTPGSQLRLNSSGEESVSPMEVGSTQTSAAHQPMLIPLNQFEDNSNVREQHNQKERRRRARIKEACSLLRQLVPGMSDKTDKATVFEFAARYVHFLKSHTGTKFDKDFLMKYSPY